MTLKAQQSKTKNIPTLRFPGFLGAWGETSIGSLVENVGGTALEVFTNEKGSHKFISIGNYSTDGKYIDNGQRIVLNDKTKTKLLNKGDLTMVLNDKTASGDLIGSTILIDEDNKFIYNQRTERLICGENFDPNFAWHFLNSTKFRKRIVTISQGGTQIYVNFPSVKKEKINIPQKEEQQKIASFLGGVDEWIGNLCRQKEALLDYKKGMMQKIFSQEIRFKDENSNDFGDWEEERLGDIAEVKTGSSNRDDSLNSGEYAFFDRSVDIRRSSKFLYNKEALIIAGEGLVFKPRYFNEKFDLHQRAYAILNYKLTNNWKYLYYYISYNHFWFNKMAVGTTMPSLRMDAFNRMIILLPSISEQQKIAEFLISLDNLVESRQQQITQAELWKKGLMQGLFV